MEIKSLFGVSKKDLLDKRHNIIVPICLGNKFFTENFIPTKNLREYIRFALDNTKEKVLVVIVDKIQDTNIFVRMNNKTEVAATRLALKQGQIIKENVYKLLKEEFSKELLYNKIEIINYEECEEKNPNFLKTTNLIYKFYKNNKDFAKEVIRAVKDFVKDRQFKEEQHLKLCDYVLDEFGFCFISTNYKNYNYDLFLYPDIDEVFLLFDDIKKGKRFIKLKNQVDFIDKTRVNWCILNN